MKAAGTEVVEITITLSQEDLRQFSEEGFETLRHTLQTVASGVTSEAGREKRLRDEDTVSARDVRVGFERLCKGLGGTSTRQLLGVSLGGTLLGVSLSALASMELEPTLPVLTTFLAVAAAGVGGVLIAPAVFRLLLDP